MNDAWWAGTDEPQRAAPPSAVVLVSMTIGAEQRSPSATSHAPSTTSARSVRRQRLVPPPRSPTTSPCRRRQPPLLPLLVNPPFSV